MEASPTSTETPTPSATPSPTRVLGPPGSGPVEPEFEVVFDTPLADLDPGEYLVLSEAGSGELDGVNEYRYISLDGRTQGWFFHLVHLKPSLRAFVETIREGRVWFETQGPVGVYTVDLASFDARQFSFGFGCKAFFDRRLIGEHFVGFACEAADSNGLAHSYYAVAWPEEKLVGAWRVEGMYMNTWIAPNVAEFVPSWGREETVFERCLVKAPQWTPECQSLLFAVRKTSPDGIHFSAAYSWEQAAQLFGEEKFNTAVPIVVAETRCLSAQLDDCTLKPVSPPPEWQGDYYADATYTIWSPDSEKLLVMDVQCADNVQPGSWIWYYDLADGRSVPLAKDSGCDEFRSEKGIWSDDGQRFVVQRFAVQNQPSIMLVSLDGRVTRLPVTGYVVGKLTVP